MLIQSKIRLSDLDYEKLRAAGNGNASAGARILIKIYGHNARMPHYARARGTRNPRYIKLSQEQRESAMAAGAGSISRFIEMAIDQEHKCS